MPLNRIFLKSIAHEENVSDSILPEGYGTLREALRLWEKAPKEKANVPHYMTLKKLDLREIMGYCAIVEKGLTSDMPYYRHVGGNLTMLYGREIEGMFADQVFSRSITREVIEAYERVALLKKPIFSIIKWNILPRAKGYYRLILPYRYKSEQVNFFLTVIMPTDTKITKASDWKTAEEALAWAVEE